MNWFIQGRFFSVAVAVILTLSWITGSNHCVLELVDGTHTGAAAHVDCPEHSKKSDNSPCSMLACCNGLKSPAFEVASIRVLFHAMLLAVQLFSTGEMLLPQPPQEVLVGGEYDIGPPWIWSFAENVLQCSLFENAPPFVA